MSANITLGTFLSISSYNGGETVTIPD
jgi:hypothetical protein